MVIRFSKTLLILGIAFTLAGANTFRGDPARTGNYSGLSLRPPLRQVYRITLNGAILSSPLVTGDTVYVGARDSSVYCLKNDAVIWHFKTRGWVDASPALDNGKLYAASRDGNVYVLDARTGDSLGVIGIGSTICSSPLMYDTLLIVGAGGWALDIKAYSLKTGNNAWSYTNAQMVYSSPAVDSGVLVFGDNSGTLTALNPHTGNELWRYQTGGDVYLSTPAIYDGVVYFSPGGYDAETYAISLQKGIERWKAAALAEKESTPVNRRIVYDLLRYRPEVRTKLIAGYQRFLGMPASLAKKLTAAVSAQGSADQFVSYGGAATSSSAVGDRNVFITRMEYGYPEPRFTMYAYDRLTGQEKWRFTELRESSLSGFCSSPVVVDSTVYFGWGEGKVYALHAKTGEKLWEDSLDGEVLSSPVVGKNRLYVATVNGSLYTYALDAPKTTGFSDGTYCYPNPARGDHAYIRVLSNKKADMTMTIFNTAEKPITTIHQAMQPGIRFTYDWNISRVANGAYMVKVTVKYADGGGTDTKVLKLAVLR